MKIKEIYEKIKAAGIQAENSPFECQFYGFDVTPLPKEAYYIFNGHTPNIITRPKNAEEVSFILSLASKEGVPVTPRGGGTSGYFQSVPRKRGILIETLAMKEIGQVNPNSKTITVGSGTIWSDLEWELGKQGYCLKTYPTSFRSSTIAGWMQTEGAGVGSLMFGTIRKLITHIEAVMPTGEIITVKKGDSVKSGKGSISFDDFFKSEGMMGMITKVELEVREKPKAVSTHLLMFTDNAHFSKYAAKLEGMPGIYFVEFVNGAYLDLLKLGKFHAPEHTENNVSAVIRFEGDEVMVKAGVAVLKEMIASDPTIKELDTHEAEEEYAERLDYFRIKCAFPSVTPADIQVPTTSLGKMLEKCSKFRFKMAYKGELLGGNNSGIMFFMVLGNELSAVRFMSTAPYQMEIIFNAMRLGGGPNGGIGMLNTPYVYGLKTYEERMKFVDKKEELDPAWIMNPGKWPDPPFYLRPYIYFTGMKCLEPVCAIVNGIRRRW
jgi:glycolate oxidase